MTKMNATQTPGTAPATELTEEELEKAQGGIGLLLPAIQKVREAAVKTSTSGITDGSSNIVAGDGSV